MRIRIVIHSLLALLVTLCMACSAYAITSFGKHPYYQPPLESVADLHKMVSENPADIKTGLTAAGLGDVYDSFMAQLPDADIQAVDYQKGQVFKGMLYRTNGKGPVKVAKNVVWESDTPAPGYEFFIDHEGQRYTFAVPFACGNLALINVAAMPAPAKVEPEAAVETPVAEPMEEMAKLMPWVVDLGLMYQTDPATYLIARGGYEHFFNDNWSVLGMIGFAPKLEGDDGTSAFLIDVFANYYFTPSAWVGLGLGGWLTDEDDNEELDDDDSDLDIMLDLGYQFYEKPNSYKLSGFVEIRSAIDELDDFDLYGRIGAGLRVHF